MEYSLRSLFLYMMLDDVGKIKRRDAISNTIRINVLQNHFIPDRSYSLPAKPNKKGKNWCFSLSWLDNNYSWLVYSKSKNACHVLCLQRAPATKDAILVHWLKAHLPNLERHLAETVTNHNTLSYHQNAVTFQHEFMQWQNAPLRRLDCQLLEQRETDFQRNKAALKVLLSELITAASSRFLCEVLVMTVLQTKIPIKAISRLCSNFWLKPIPHCDSFWTRVRKMPNIHPKLYKMTYWYNQ